MIEDKNALIKALRKQSKTWHSTSFRVVMILAICFFGWGLYYIRSLTIKYAHQIGDEKVSMIAIIAKNIFTIHLFALVIGLLIGFLISKIWMKYNKDDLLIELNDRIEVLETKLKDKET